jgi:hypothetical protein
LLGGGGDQEDGQGGGDERENQGEGESTLPQDPPTETIKLQKRKVFPKKSSARKNMCASNPHLEATFTNNDINLVFETMEDALEDIF